MKTKEILIKNYLKKWLNVAFEMGKNNASSEYYKKNVLEKVDKEVSEILAGFF